MKQILLIPAIFFLLISCNKNNDDTSNVKIRISNISEYDFTNVCIDTSTGITCYGDIVAGQKSEYKTFEKAYRYSYVELKIETNTLKLIPTDYVGESLLTNGNYSYEINALDTESQFGSLTLNLKKEN